MPAYTELKDLNDWDEDTALIEIAPDGTAIVREPIVQMIPNIFTPFSEAVVNAQTLMARCPWITRLAVRLQDGATWDSRNGDLTSL